MTPRRAPRPVVPDRWYCLYISNRAGHLPGGEPESSLRWSGSFDSLGGAQEECRRLVDKGLATIAFTAVYGRGAELFLNGTVPKSAAKIIRHYLEAMDAVRRGPPR